MLNIGVILILGLGLGLLVILVLVFGLILNLVIGLYLGLGLGLGLKLGLIIGLCLVFGKKIYNKEGLKMATRGTYQFVDDATKTTIYVHWDNYLEGAANYFYNMLTNPSKGNLATQFIRAVSHAEITRSHARHGDTEFQYNIKGSDGGAELVVNSPCTNTVMYSGTIIDFIEKHNKLIEDYKPIRKYVNEWGVSNYINADMARKIIEDKLNTMEVWKDKDSSNWKSYAEHIKTIVECFPELEEYVVEL